MMERDEERVLFEAGQEQLSKRGGYTTDAEMSIQSAPTGPGAGAGDLPTHGDDARAGTDDDRAAG
jgi:hypothetical protein